MDKYGGGNWPELKMGVVSRHTIYSHTVHVITTAHRIVFANDIVANATTRRRSAFCFSFSFSLLSLFLSSSCTSSSSSSNNPAYTFPNRIQLYYTQRVNNQTENGRALAHERKVNSLDFNLSGEYLASGSVDQTIRVGTRRGR